MYSIEQWVIDKMENTDLDIDQMLSAFIEEFGNEKVDQYNEAVDNYLNT